MEDEEEYAGEYEGQWLIGKELLDYEKFIDLSQCCGSQFIFFVFGSTNFFSESDLYTNILIRNVLKGQFHEKFGEMRVWGLSLGHN
jgi:hypothetical protein